MMSAQEMVVEVRDLLDAAFLAFDGDHKPRVSVTDVGYTDEQIQLALNGAKRSLWRTIATKQPDWFMRQDTIVYPADAESIRIAAPGGVLSRPVYRMLLVEDMTDVNFPLPIPRTNFATRVQTSLHIYVNGYRYSERGGNFYLLPALAPELSIRFSYVPEPTAIDTRSEGPDEEVPAAAIDWLCADAACRAAVRYGAVPTALREQQQAARLSAMSVLVSKVTGPQFGRWTRNDYSNGCE